MSKQRRNHSATFKAKVALDAIKGDKTMSELASHYSLHPTQIQNWKKQLLDGSKEIFGSSEKERKNVEQEIRELHEKIGKLTMERDFLAQAFGR